MPSDDGFGSVRASLRLKFLSTEFFHINGFDKHSEIASTPLTDGADTYYREGRFWASSASDLLPP
jgi:hypothetical protein